MKTYLYLLIIFLISGCIKLNKTQLNPEIKKFESTLGKEKANDLTKMVIYFEKDLKQQYKTKNILDAYRIYLKSLHGTGSIYYKWENSKRQEETGHLLKKNGLETELWLKSDSAWYEGKRLRYRFIYQKDTIIHSYYGQNKLSNDPQNLITDKKIEFNFYGSYYKALQEVAKTNEYISKYIEATTIAGTTSGIALTGGFLLQDADFSDYFIKRIILIDICFSDYSKKK